MELSCSLLLGSRFISYHCPALPLDSHFPKVEFMILDLLKLVQSSLIFLVVIFLEVSNHVQNTSLYSLIFETYSFSFIRNEKALGSFSI